MKRVISTLIFAFVCFVQGYEFPDNFTFGVSSASYQIEGAWDVNGKGENIWDHLTHTNPGHIADSSNGDIAANAYYKTAEDVQLLRNLGVNFYRFSLSWARILPYGHADYVNPDGVRYYNELIDTLLANGITPLVTMYHWDMPQALQEIGGWPSPRMVDFYVDYADIVFSYFGDRVKNWITINEPYMVCEMSYAAGVLAPAYLQHGIGNYLCGHSLLLAHGKAYRLYDEKYRASQQGRVGITIDSDWREPNSTSEEDIEAAENVLKMTYGWFANPIFSTTGDYPSGLRERVDALSEQQGFTRSRLPYFTEDEIEIIKGSFDFMGLNHYSSWLCSPSTGDAVSELTHEADVGTYCYQPDDWEATAVEIFKVTPWGLRKLLNWIKNEYDNPEIIITENGYADSTGELNDCGRVNFFNSYLTEILNAIHEDECNVTGYSAWSFVSTFEWNMGYTASFGLYHVDFNDTDRTRHPTMTSYVYKNIIETRNIDENYTPDGFTACTTSD